jgi:hypothetical protein
MLLSIQEQESDPHEKSTVTDTGNGGQSLELRASWFLKGSDEGYHTPNYWAFDFSHRPVF